MNTHPVYQRRKPTPQDLRSFATNRIDLTSCHLPPYPEPDASGTLPDSRPLADALWDARGAAVVAAAVPDPTAVAAKVGSLLESHQYDDSGTKVLIPSPQILAVMAYADYFPNAPGAANLAQIVSDTILASSPGWCGTFGNDVDTFGQSSFEGNYDMTQMFLLPLAYAYYDELTPAAHEHLVTQLLAGGHVHRAGESDTVTSGQCPNDWSRAGHVQFIANFGDIPETENHVLMIATARYLTNQLLFPRNLGRPVILGIDRSLQFDNRRNGDPSNSVPTCMDQVLLLLRNKLRDDFSEYNAKPYQDETRRALLNLYTYAYDAEVRLAARMVLDYQAAHLAVSSCDARRMVPFRRRDEDSVDSRNTHQDPDDPGFLRVGLLDAHGADAMSTHIALVSGNTRGYQLADPTVWDDDGGQPFRPWAWGIPRAAEIFIDFAGDYRLAPSVHDLFVNDRHRRFYQRLHRFSMLDEPGQQRNCDNLEIYSGSPSYLFSAGGRPAIWVIPGKDGKGYQQQNLGVAVPISFMPVGTTSGGVSSSDAREIIQIMHFSDTPTPENGIDAAPHGGTENYGVGPDFACGIASHIPDWARPGRLQEGIDGIYPDGIDGLFFAHSLQGPAEPAGFFLALHRWGSFVLLEAFDTWRHPEVTFDAFKAKVKANSPASPPMSGIEQVYTTFFGNKIHYVIWQKLEIDNHQVGSKITNIEYATDGDPADTLSAAGTDTAPFLSGNILQCPRDGLVTIKNPALGTTLTLDWSDAAHLIRVSETGEAVEAGNGPWEVWVDFAWKGAQEGDFYRPFNTMEAAVAAVHEGGVIRIVPGSKLERLTIHKRVRIQAPGGPVTFSAR